jgi:limonene-1,2-epoxide hydrolase
MACHLDLRRTSQTRVLLRGTARFTCPGLVTLVERRDGKIAAWRDYWDFGQFNAQLPAKTD